MNPSLYLTRLIAVCGLLLFSGCATNPVTGKKQFVLSSEKQEIAMGKEADPQIIAFFGLYEHPTLQKFITEKGLQMAAVSHRPKLAYEFKIVDSPVINAFAVPGGYVYFTRGIMAQFNSEAEFAGVLGHEIGHITARHSVIQQRNAILGQIGIIAGVVLVPELSRFVEPISYGMQLALMSFGREAERESDKLGVEYATRIGYDAAEMAGFFETLERHQTASGGGEIPEFLSTHPSPGARKTTVEKLALEWKEKLKLTDAKINRDSYLRKIDGMVFGEDPRDGFLESGVFYHPKLKFSFPVPTAWRLQNSPQQVQMAPENGEALLVLTLAAGTSLQDASDKILAQYNLEKVESRKETHHGLSSLITIADQKQEQGTIRVMSALIQFNGNIYSLMGISELSKFSSYTPTFLGTIQHFQELKEAEKLNRKPDIILIKSVPNAMTLQSALQYFNMPTESFEKLAMLNQMNLSDRLSGGTLIKVTGKMK
jgi:predicted Zn-dependent protease